MKKEPKAGRVANPTPNCFQAALVNGFGVESDVDESYEHMMVNAAFRSKEPYRRRTWLRQHLPFWALFCAPKGSDCEAAGGRHEWYNHDDANSGCYHCKVIAAGQRWEM